MKKFNIEFKWAIIIYFVTLAWSFVEKITGYHDEKINQYAYFSLLFFLILPFLYIKAIKEKKDSYYKGTMTWQQGMVSGVIISFIYMLTCPFSQLVIHNIISPNFFKNSIQAAIKTNSMTKSQAENYFNLSSFIIQSAFGAISFGIVFAGIAGLILQSKSKK